MTKQEALLLVENWKKDSSFLLEENECFFLSVFLPVEYIEKIDNILLKDKTDFDDLIMDAEYAYLVLNKMQEEEFVSIYTYEGAKKEAEKIRKSSPYKNKEDYIETFISVKAEEMDALSYLLNKEKLENSSYTMDDLFKDFIDSYLRVDLSLLKVLEEDAFEAVNEDFRKKN